MKLDVSIDNLQLLAAHRLKLIPTQHSGVVLIHVAEESCPIDVLSAVCSNIKAPPHPLHRVDREGDQLLQLDLAGVVDVEALEDHAQMVIRRLCVAQIEALAAHRKPLRPIHQPRVVPVPQLEKVPPICCVNSFPRQLPDSVRGEGGALQARSDLLHQTSDAITGLRSSMPERRRVVVQRDLGLGRAPGELHWQADVLQLSRIHSRLHEVQLRPRDCDLLGAANAARAFARNAARAFVGKSLFFDNFFLKVAFLAAQGVLARHHRARQHDEQHARPRDVLLSRVY
mmetsp:Transcript_11323/g.28459  ORF Transcript_11323/g.28459 Transcript_11323/m.28459 type:complete len:285 (+) Transcript_11323:1348-2202(+)